MRLNRSSVERRGTNKREMRHDAKQKGNDIIKLNALPIDVLRRILTHADVHTLLRLSETSGRLNEEVGDDSLWRHLCFRRFRITARTTLSKRLQSAGDLRWRTLYANWHMQGRMPMSRYSGPSVSAFGKGRAGGTFVWLTVTSADDCRLRDGVLRVRLIVQNVSACRVRVLRERVAFCIRMRGLIAVNANSRTTQDVHARVVERFVERSHQRCTLNVPADVLFCDDFEIVSAEVRIKSAVFEIDALEQLEYVFVPIVADDKRVDVVCKLSDRQIWQCYEMLPGGWWARIG